MVTIACASFFLSNLYLAGGRKDNSFKLHQEYIEHVCFMYVVCVFYLRGVIDKFCNCPNISKATCNRCTKPACVSKIIYLLMCKVSCICSVPGMRSGIFKGYHSVQYVIKLLDFELAHGKTFGPTSKFKE